MKKRNRLFAFILAIVLILCVVPFDVSANSPEPAPHYTFYLTNLPEGTLYVDLLIWLPEADEMYVALNEKNIPVNFSENAEIFSYCEENYRSYTFHYLNAVSAMKLGPNNEVFFFADEKYSQIQYKHGEEIDTRGAVRLAMLDARGNILKVSPLLDLNEIDKFSYRLNYFYYDAETDALEIEAIYDNMLDPPNRYIVTGLIATVFSAVTEWLTSFLFTLKGRRCMIFSTNIVSQLLMHGAYALLYLYSSWSYLTITIVLEIMVYLGEFLFYCWRAKGEPKKTWLGYTVLANTLSLLAGPILAVLGILAWQFEFNIVSFFS